MARRARQRDEEKAAYWRAAIGRRETSGQSVRTFCMSEKVKESAYYHWRRELARRDAEPPAQNSDSANGAALVPVELLNDHNGTAPVEIVAGSGYVVRVGEQATAEHVCRVLHAIRELG